MTSRTTNWSNVTTATELYPEVDTLSDFEHPDYNRTFEYCSPRQLIKQARWTNRQLRQSPFEQVVVSETGAVPFIRICQALPGSDSLSFKSLKVPREPTASTLKNFLMHHLSDQQLQISLEDGRPRRSHIVEHCARLTVSPDRYGHDLESTLSSCGETRADPDQKELASTLQGTPLSEWFSRPFLFYDEYFDSGTTLRSARAHWQCLSRDPTYRLGAYLIHTTNPRRYESVEFSLFGAGNKPTCFDQGVYPFENRVDLIGHFYCLDDKTYRKVPVRTFRERSNPDFPKKLFSTIRERLDIKAITRTLKNECELEPVGTSLDFLDVYRYLVWVLEDEVGTREGAEFLWALFDMYGPIWTPLPGRYHRDFWQAFEKLHRPLYQRIDPDLKQFYDTVRTGLLSEAAAVCSERRATWNDTINRTMEAMENEREQPD